MKPGPVILAVIGLAIGVAFARAQKLASVRGVAAPKWIAVVDEDGKPTAQKALFKTQSYLDSGAPFGPVYPVLFTQDEGGLFLFTGDGPSKAWKPTYVVTFS